MKSLRVERFFQSFKVMEPIPFILTGDDGTSLLVDPRAKEALGKIEKPVVVVSVVDQCAGPDGCGTGPPFLLHKTTKQLVVKRAITARPVETVTKLMTKGSDPLSESAQLELPSRSSRTH